MSAMLSSTVNTCSASVWDAFGRILHIFCCEMDSNPVASSSFSRRIEKCAQQMPHFPVQLAMRTFSSNSTWLAAVMMVLIFGSTCVK